MVSAFVAGLLSLTAQAVPTTEESIARLTKVLQEEVTQGSVTLSDVDGALVVRLKAAQALEPVDRRWRTLGAIAVESRKSSLPLRVEVVDEPGAPDWEQQLKVCGRHFEGTVFYLYKKQGVDRNKVTVIGRCTIGH